MGNCLFKNKNKNKIENNEEKYNNILYIDTDNLENDCINTNIIYIDNNGFFSNWYYSSSES